MSPRILFSILFLLFNSFIFAQTHSAPIEWGLVAKSDLEMTSYEKDPNAKAVVLADYGVIDVQDTGNMYKYEFTHHKRIKILDKTAFDEGNISIPFYKEDKIYGLKAQTLNPDGTITELTKKDFYQEDINLYYKRKKFSLPNIQVGSIIEYKYSVSSERLAELPEWYFQGELPVRYSEVVVYIHHKFEYVFLFQGQKRTPEEDDEDGVVVINDNQFVMRNAPALKEEAYITSMNNYRTRLRFQLSKVYYTNRADENVLTTWDELADELKHGYKFGQQYRFKRSYNKVWKMVEPLLAAATTDDEKINIIYDFVQNKITWNQYYGIYADDTLDKTLEEGTGDVAAINLMLVALMQEAGVDAYPLLCSSRGNGMITKKYPIIDQFNYLLACVEQGEETLLLDASSADHTLGMIREDALNYTGWLVDGKNSRWKYIEPQKSSDILWAQLDLSNEGNIEGIFKGRSSGYSGMDERRRYRADGEDFWKERLSERIPDLKVDEISFKNEDDHTKPFSTEIQFTWEGASQGVGDILYVSPIIYTSFSENPFKSETRLYPVEIPYPIKEQMIINFNIPEGYAVEELPEKVNLAFPNKDASFRFLAEVKGNMITITSRVEVNRLIYDTPEYEAIKGFYDTIVESFSEQIVLKKI